MPYYIKHTIGVPLFRLSSNVIGSPRHLTFLTLGAEMTGQMTLSCLFPRQPTPLSPRLPVRPSVCLSACAPFCLSASVRRVSVSVAECGRGSSVLSQSVRWRPQRPASDRGRAAAQCNNSRSELARTHSAETTRDTDKFLVSNETLDTTYHYEK